MKAHLMFESRDFDLHREISPHEQALIQDLELNTLLNVMASGDPFLEEVAQKAILSGGGQRPADDSLSPEHPKGLPE